MLHREAYHGICDRSQVFPAFFLHHSLSLFIFLIGARAASRGGPVRGHTEIEMPGAEASQLSVEDRDFQANTRRGEGEKSLLQPRSSTQAVSITYQRAAGQPNCDFEGLDLVGYGYCRDATCTHSMAGSQTCPFPVGNWTANLGCVTFSQCRQLCAQSPSCIGIAITPEPNPMYEWEAPCANVGLPRCVVYYQNPNGHWNVPTKVTNFMTHYHCYTFSEANKMCGWRTGREWQRRWGPVPNTEMGPTGDHTSNAADYYSFVNSSGTSQDAFELSATVSVSEPVNMSFWYQTGGNADGNLTLRVLPQDCDWVDAWVETGNTSVAVWTEATVEIPVGSAEIRFRAISDSQAKRVIALDDISFWREAAGITSTVSSLPNCNFDVGSDPFCGWTSNDKFTRGVATPSYFTGPDSDYTFGELQPRPMDGGYFVFTEASDRNSATPCRGNCFLIESPPLTLDIPMVLLFAHHLYGSHIGSLEVEVETDCVWSTAWSLVGNQGNNWAQSSVDLPANTTMVRFRGTAGAGYTGDLAIDDLTFVHVPCPQGFWGQQPDAAAMGLCVACAPGRYNQDIGSTHPYHCRSCPVGTWSNASGASDSDTGQECAPGTWSQQDGNVGPCNDCGPGTWSSAQGQSAASSCQACPAGRWSAVTGASNSDACQDCPVGRWSDSVQATSVVVCTLCSAGTSNHLTGAQDPASCQQCGPGFWSQEAAETCEACEAGRFSEQIGASSNETCIPCPMGRWSNTAGVSACEQCDAGAWSEQLGSLSNDTCVPCETGKWGQSAGASACTDCRPGTWNSEIGAGQESSCTECPAGLWSNASGATSNSTCQECPPGTSGSLPGAPSADVCDPCGRGRWSGAAANVCTPCVPGRAGTEVGATNESACFSCTPGTFSDIYGASECAACPGGTWTNQGQTTLCTPCPPGTTSNEVGATNGNGCTACQPGRFSARGEDNCTECGFGAWSDGIGATACNDCANGRWSRFLGASAAEDCMECQAGRWSAFPTNFSGDDCQPCAPGRWSQIPGLTAPEDCELCVAGSWSSEGSTACEGCGRGRWSSPTNGLMAGQCESCERGRWQGSLAATACILCETGRFNQAIGSTSQAACLPCDAGRVGPDEGAGEALQCLACPPGKWSTTLGASNASMSCLDCGAGTWSEVEGATQCTNCEKGRHSETLGASSIDTCLECPPGSWSRNLGKSACESCAAGWFGTLSGMTLNTACMSCVPGRWSSHGATSCNDCEAGRYSPSLRASSEGHCQACPAGRWNAMSGGNHIEACTLCDAGKWSNETGANTSATCQYCPAGRWSLTPAVWDSSFESRWIQELDQDSGAVPGGIESMTLGTFDQCRKCDAGSWSDDIGADSHFYCRWCVAGRWSLAGSTNCTECPAGRASALPGAPSEDNCTICPAGSWSEAGATECVACGKGYFGRASNATDNSTCEPCEAGRWSGLAVAGGPASCAACAPGTFSDTVASSACTPCGRGTYADMEGSTTCMACPDADGRDRTRVGASCCCPQHNSDHWPVWPARYLNTPPFRHRARVFRLEGDCSASSDTAQPPANVNHVRTGNTTYGLTLATGQDLAPTFSGVQDCAEFDCGSANCVVDKLDGGDLLGPGESIRLQAKVYTRPSGGQEEGDLKLEPCAQVAEVIVVGYGCSADTLRYFNYATTGIIVAIVLAGLLSECIARRLGRAVAVDCGLDISWAADAPGQQTLLPTAAMLRRSISEALVQRGLLAKHGRLSQDRFAVVLHTAGGVDESLEDPKGSTTSRCADDALPPTAVALAPSSSTGDASSSGIVEGVQQQRRLRVDFGIWAKRGQHEACRRLLLRTAWEAPVPPGGRSGTSWPMASPWGAETVVVEQRSPSVVKIQGRMPGEDPVALLERAVLGHCPSRRGSAAGNCDASGSAHASVAAALFTRLATPQGSLRLQYLLGFQYFLNLAFCLLPVTVPLDDLSTCGENSYPARLHLAWLIQALVSALGTLYILRFAAGPRATTFLRKHWCRFLLRLLITPLFFLDLYLDVVFAVVSRACYFDLWLVAAWTLFVGVALVQVLGTALMAAHCFSQSRRARTPEQRERYLAECLYLALRGSDNFALAFAVRPALEERLGGRSSWTLKCAEARVALLRLAGEDAEQLALQLAFLITYREAAAQADQALVWVSTVISVLLPVVLAAQCLPEARDWLWHRALPDWRPPAAAMGLLLPRKHRARWFRGIASLSAVAASDSLAPKPLAVVNWRALRSFWLVIAVVLLRVQAMIPWMVSCSPAGEPCYEGVDDAPEARGGCARPLMGWLPVRPGVLKEVVVLQLCSHLGAVFALACLMSLVQKMRRLKPGRKRQNPAYPGERRLSITAAEKVSEPSDDASGINGVAEEGPVPKLPKTAHADLQQMSMTSPKPALPGPPPVGPHPGTTAFPEQPLSGQGAAVSTDVDIAESIPVKADVTSGAAASSPTAPQAPAVVERTTTSGSPGLRTMATAMGRNGTLGGAEKLRPQEEDDCDPWLSAARQALGEASTHGQSWKRAIEVVDREIYGMTATVYGKPREGPGVDFGRVLKSQVSGTISFDDPRVQKLLTEAQQAEATASARKWVRQLLLPGRRHGNGSCACFQRLSIVEKAHLIDKATSGHAPLRLVHWETLEAAGELPAWDRAGWSTASRRGTGEQPALGAEAVADEKGEPGPLLQRLMSTGLTLPEAEKSVLTLYVSHRWLRTRGPPEARHPDSPEGAKAMALVALARWLKAQSQALGRRCEVCFWIDWSCLRQDDALAGDVALAALPLYIAACDQVVAWKTHDFERSSWAMSDRLLAYAFCPGGLTPFVLDSAAASFTGSGLGLRSAELGITELPQGCKSWSEQGLEQVRRPRRLLDPNDPQVCRAPRAGDRAVLRHLAELAKDARPLQIFGDRQAIDFGLTEVVELHVSPGDSLPAVWGASIHAASKAAPAGRPPQAPPPNAWLEAHERKTPAWRLVVEKASDSTRLNGARSAGEHAETLFWVDHCTSDPLPPPPSASEIDQLFDAVDVAYAGQALDGSAARKEKELEGPIRNLVAALKADLLSALRVAGVTDAGPGAGEASLFWRGLSALGSALVGDTREATRERDSMETRRLELALQRSRNVELVEKQLVTERLALLRLQSALDSGDEAFMRGAVLEAQMTGAGHLELCGKVHAEQQKLYEEKFRRRVAEQLAERLSSRRQLTDGATGSSEPPADKEKDAQLLQALFKAARGHGESSLAHEALRESCDDVLKSARTDRDKDAVQTLRKAADHSGWQELAKNAGLALQHINVVTELDRAETAEHLPSLRKMQTKAKELAKEQPANGFEEAQERADSLVHKVASRLSEKLDLPGPAEWPVVLDLEGESVVGVLKKSHETNQEIKDKIQQMVNDTYTGWGGFGKLTRTKDRAGEPIADELRVREVVFVQNAESYVNYVGRRREITEEIASSGATGSGTKIKTDWDVKTMHISMQGNGRLEKHPLDANINEVYLWHGTTPDAAREITNREFDLRKSGSRVGTLFGHGIYFAESSMKADEYTRRSIDDADVRHRGLFPMILCRVVLGNIKYCDDKYPGSIKHVLEESCKKGNGFHSVLGDREKVRQTFREFIVFDKDQVYPEYIVWYQRLARRERTSG